MSSAAELLGANGPFALSVKHFRDRPAQREMAAAVEATIEQQQTLLVEAGTGTGKTYAYLVPAIASGAKVVVSTATKHLQNQLFHRDLPQVLRTLDADSDCALLKGRANYLCWHRLENALGDGHRYAPEDMQTLLGVKAWARRTQSGDISEAPDVSENWPHWSAATSTAENCLGQDCDHYKECFVVKARRAAQEADIVVVNHYLLFADMALKDEGFGDLLPTAEVVVVDEAHHVPDIATKFFGLTLTARQVLNLCRDITVELGQLANDVPDLVKLLRKVEHLVREQRLSFGDGEFRGQWRDFTQNPDVEANWQSLLAGLDELASAAKLLAERSTGLQNCYERAVELKNKADAVAQGRMPAEDVGVAVASEGNSAAASQVAGQAANQGLAQNTDQATAKNTNQDAWVCWVETRGRGFAVNITPLDISRIYQQQIANRPAAWIYASATLAVSNSFDHFAKRIGSTAPKTLCLDSPFDYQKNTLLYLPTGLPEPREMNYTDTVIEKAVPVIKAAGGRCFFLFTSYRALQHAARVLSRSLRFPLLVQGEASRSDLLDQFSSLGNAVLLGTSSFWEGVDVRGEALSLVIIDKLPFASPGDPVVSAKIDTMRRNGANPFNDFQVPQSVIALKQGVGRLIRDYDDTGVLMLCDPRLTTKAYGKTFLASLPHMPQTNSEADVVDFIDHLSLV